MRRTQPKPPSSGKGGVRSTPKPVGPVTVKRRPIPTKRGR